MNTSPPRWPGGDDPNALDAQYNLRGHPDRDPSYADYAQRSALLRASDHAQLDLAYGDHPRARLDVFHAPNPRAVLVFFHGGYWRALDRQLFSFLAQPFLDMGLSVVTPDYPLAPHADLGTIVDHAQSAMEWVVKNVAQSPQLTLPLLVSGHSAGGHLAAMCAHHFDPGGAAIVGSIPISGLFELEPLQRTNVNEALRLNANQITALSPMRGLPPARVDSLVLVGGDETAGFRWQSDAYSAHLRAAGLAAEFEVVAGLNHFTILGALANAEHPVHGTLTRHIERCLQRCI